MNKQPIRAVPDALREALVKTPRAAVAFSGGVDSSYLLYAALACGLEVRAYYVQSQFQPQFELRDARRLAREVQAEMTILPVDVLADKTVSENPADRCYFCKQVIFKTILEKAAADGYTVVMDGSNASDDASDRPGMRALTELAVRSPLREAGLSKDMVRAYSKQAGLFTWDKPSYACLATRIPTGAGITAELLQKIEQSEDILFSMGFTDFRVRVMGDAAKLQLPENQMADAAARAREIHRALSPYFREVLLDLKPR